mmetsp:Transcript_9941/g.15114  ORF Transcript_9941/g.15114 Transcript_9941/m.15114 type:complete len:96 (+) Transcript_9941:69-356(+)
MIFVSSLLFLFEIKALVLPNAYNGLKGPTRSRRIRNEIVMKDYPKPNVENTQPYRDATKLSERFSSDLKADSSQKKKNSYYWWWLKWFILCKIFS